MLSEGFPILYLLIREYQALTLRYPARVVSTVQLENA
jgi:hypothetical protein